jgi:hypothetical protein
MTNTLDTLSDERAKLEEVENRLVEEYGADRREAVHTALAEEHRRFENASVHAFVPILVERSVRARLG